MAKSPPKKPTRPFGTIVFGKDGSVRRKISQLPDVKMGQEASVVESFCRDLERFYGHSVGDVSLLAEADHDARIGVDDQPVLLQVAEIVQRGFELPAGEPNKGDPKAIAFFDATSANATALDLNALNDSMLSAIERKLHKHYAKPSDSALWLLLFTTSSFIPMEYWENDRLTVGEPLRRARERFRARSWQPFDEVWFTDLRTRPVRVLPSEPS